MNRFYQLEQASGKTFGHIHSVVGLAFSGQDNKVYLALGPTSPVNAKGDNIIVERLTLEEMDELIHFSDNPEFLDETTKQFHRKARFEISGSVQQKIWVADGCKCMFCRRPMGEVQLSIDHFMPLELGGANNVSNYLSACRKCNKDKGNKHPETFCSEIGIDYQDMLAYIVERNKRTGLRA